MKINGNQIRPGNVINHRGGLWRAVKIQHTQPGKGGAYMQVELKSLKDGTKLNERFRASQTVERAILEQREHQYLYGDGDSYTFMDLETFDQVTLPAEDLGESAAYLHDDMKVMIEMHQGNPIGISLADTVILEVAETEPVVKGQTAASSNKPAKLANGVRTMVPPFVSAGDRIIVNTADGTYVKRAD